MVPGLAHKSFLSFDGTRIAYHVRGQEGAPALVFANGLGGSCEAFRHVFAALGDSYRIFCWDYRGLYGSERPRDLATLAIPSHCRDLAALLEHEQVSEAIFVGWSMGVQVLLEFFRHHRRRMRALIALSGSYGTPFRTAMAARLTRHVIPPLLRTMKTRALVPMVPRLGLASERIDREALCDLAEDFKTLDFELYSEQLRVLGHHDARDVLPAIDIPVLTVTGDDAPMTPVFTARKMNQQISGSRLLVLEGGSHYTPLEFPDEIGREVRLFVRAIPGWRIAEAA